MNFIKGSAKKNPEDFIRDKKSGEAILKQKDFLEIVNKTLGYKVAGEEKNRLLLFLIMISYKFLKPIHGIIQAKSSNGKSYLIESVVISNTN